MQHECGGFLITSVGTIRLNLSTRSLIKVVRNAVTPVRLDRILSRGLRDLAVSGLRERQSLLRACRRRKSSACKTGPLGRE